MSAKVRVTRVRSWTRAVAAISPSMDGSFRGAYCLPHSAAISAVTGRIRSEKCVMSPASHSASASARSLP